EKKRREEKRREEKRRVVGITSSLWSWRQVCDISKNLQVGLCVCVSVSVCGGVGDMMTNDLAHRGMCVCVYVRFVWCVWVCVGGVVGVLLCWWVVGGVWC